MARNYRAEYERRTERARERGYANYYSQRTANRYKVEYQYASNDPDKFAKGYSGPWDPSNPEFRKALDVYYRAMHGEDYNDYLEEWYCDWVESYDRDEWEALYG